MTETVSERHIREALGFQESSNARQNSAGFKRLRIQSTQWQIDHDAPRPGPVTKPAELLAEEEVTR